MLACPQCHGPLAYDPNNESLECQTCRLRFRVADGIPVLLLDEAEKLE